MTKQVFICDIDKAQKNKCCVSTNPTDPNFGQSGKFYFLFFSNNLPFLAIKYRKHIKFNIGLLKFIAIIETFSPNFLLNYLMYVALNISYNP